MTEPSSLWRRLPITVKMLLPLALVAHVVVGCVDVAGSDGLAEQGDVDGTSVEAIIGGQSASNNPNPTAWTLGIGRTCSGTRIGPRFFLTAGHCVDEEPTQYKVGGRLAFQNSVSRVQEEMLVKGVHPHPGYRPGGGGVDLAIIETYGEVYDGNTSANGTATITTTPPRGPTERRPLGEEIRFYGSGCTSWDGVADRVMRWASANVTSVSDSAFFIKKDPGAGTPLGCGGDSGGGAFRAPFGPTWELVGVVMLGETGATRTGPFGVTGRGTLLVRVDTPDIRKWINDIVTVPAGAAVAVSPSDYPAVLGFQGCSGVRVADTLIMTSQSCVTRAGIASGQEFPVVQALSQGWVRVKRLFPYDGPPDEKGRYEDVAMIETENHNPIGSTVPVLTSRALTSGEKVELVSVATSDAKYALKKLDVVLAPDAQYPDELVGAGECVAKPEDLGAGVFQKLPSGETVLVGISSGCHGTVLEMSLAHDFAAWVERVKTAA
jgi:hypothetical protein